MRATIKDVARLAGCGISTVSRVLNDSGPVSAQTRASVQQAMRQLDYRVSEVGRALRVRRSGAIGCLVPSLTNPVFAEAVAGIQERLRPTGLQLIVTSSQYALERERAAIDTLINARAEAAILTVCDATDSAGLAALERHAVPFCLMFNPPASARPSVAVDNRAASAQAVALLADRGHRQLAFVALRLSSSDRSRARLAGVIERCARLHLPDPVVIELDERTAAQPELLASRLAAYPEVTGIHASNDFLALAIMRAAHRLGRRVPDDLALIGFDGIDVGSLLEPSLATMATEPAEMGWHAAEAVVMALAEERRVEPVDRLDFRFRPGGSLSPEAQAVRQPGAIRLSRSLHLTRA